MKILQIDTLVLDYNFSSVSGSLGASRYTNKYTMDIRVVKKDATGKRFSEVIGRGELHLFLIGLAMNDFSNLFEIFEASDSVLDLGHTIYDWENERFLPEYLREIEYSCNSNLLFLKKIELLPEYSEQDFLKYIIKDIVCRFESCCGLIVLNSGDFLYAGFESIADRNRKQCEEMYYEVMEPSATTVEEELSEYYRSFGFKNFLNSGYFILNPSFRNEKLEQINLNKGLKEIRFM